LFYAKYPGIDCRRIDLMIGEKAFWGQGLGTEVIRLLTAFAFEREGADLVFGCEIADYNPASLKAFQKAGYQMDAKIEQPPDGKARCCYDLILRKEQFLPSR
jgi:RimJ/RimL family protein N-acetyltransferase